MIIAAIRYLRRIWVRGEKKGADYTAPRRPSSMFFDREIRSEWHTHTSRGEIGYTHQTSQRKSLPFYQSFLICLLLRGSSQCGPSVPLLSMTTAGDGPGLLLPSSFTTRLPESSVTATCVGAVLNGNGRATVESRWPTGNFAYVFPISYSERFNQVFRTQRDSTLEK